MPRARLLQVGRLGPGRLLGLVVGLLGLSPALAFDAETEDVLNRMKVGKLVPITEIATLMRRAGLRLDEISGIAYNPLNRKAWLTRRTAVNYLVCASNTPDPSHAP